MLIHDRTDIRHQGRFLTASAPAYVGPQVWHLIAPQIRSSKAQSSYSFRNARLASWRSNRIGGLASMSPTLTPQ
jgi:hypothetical protein